MKHVNRSPDPRSLTFDQELDTITSRRHFIKSASLLTLGNILPIQSVFAAPKTTVGVIYVGARGDYGYNQAQAQAAAVIKKMPDVKVVEEENVPETIAVQKTMEAMIEQDGVADLRHFVRLLRPSRAEDGGEVSEGAIRPLRRFVEAGQPAHVSLIAKP